MRRFSSYGPLDLEENFGIDRTQVIQRVAQQLVGNPDKSGHFFTIFAPRQAGKTTTIREALAAIRAQHGDRFLAGWDILHIVKDLRASLHRILLDAIKIQVEPFPSWEAVHAFFRRGGPLKQPVILILDEFDALPKDALTKAITFFRQVYHRRDEYMLHGVALIGVHAVIGSLEGRVSPFNIQRSVHIPNLTREEVVELFGQYQQESGQAIEAEVVERIYELFRGQPGLTCWFGELLTEKYNPATPTPHERNSPPEGGYPPITLQHFFRVQDRALNAELNNNVRNLISKAQEHKEFVGTLFYAHDVGFRLYDPQLQWLYLNGVIAEEQTANQESGVCVFASPFVQKCLFSAFSSGLVEAYEKVELLTVPEKLLLHEAALRMDVGMLLEAYRQFLHRQEKKGEAPWEDQPTRSDARAYEAIGHFNLYTWLSLVLRRRMVVIPEFRTRNGTADLLLLHRETRARTVVEIKSYGSLGEHREGLEQVARYAKRLELSSGWLVVLTDESSWRSLQNEPRVYTWEGVRITVEPVPWGWVPEAARSQPPQSSSLAPPSPTPLPSGAKPSRRPRSRSRASSPPTLELEDRLALNALVLPLLTLGTVEQMWGMLGFSLSDMPQKELLLVWTELLNRCMAQGRLEKVWVLLGVMFPAVSTEPLIVRLRSELRSG